MKVAVDKGACIGCGVCETSCPDIFEMQDNVAVVKVEVLSKEQEGKAWQTAQDCPVNAITLSNQ